VIVDVDAFETEWPVEEPRARACQIDCRGLHGTLFQGPKSATPPMDSPPAIAQQAIAPAREKTAKLRERKTGPGPASSGSGGGGIDILEALAKSLKLAFQSLQIGLQFVLCVTQVGGLPESHYRIVGFPSGPDRASSLLLITCCQR